MSDFSCKARLDTPYPAISDIGDNPEYMSMMMQNVGGNVSEMTAVANYFYSGLVSREKYIDLAECFEKISITEMHHLGIFGEMVSKMGGDPRLWSRRSYGYRYWSPEVLSYPTEIRAVILYAIQGENEAIRQYTRQANYIQNQNIKEILQRIIADEELHITILNSMLETI